MDGTGRVLQVGDRIQCKDNRDLRKWALNLSAAGYGIGIIGYHDLYDNVLTIMERPEEQENEQNNKGN